MDILAITSIALTSDCELLIYKLFSIFFKLHYITLFVLGADICRARHVSSPDGTGRSARVCLAVPYFTRFRLTQNESRARIVVENAENKCTHACHVNISLDGSRKCTYFVTDRRGRRVQHYEVRCSLRNSIFRTIRDSIRQIVKRVYRAKTFFVQYRRIVTENAYIPERVVTCLLTRVISRALSAHSK